MPTESTGMTRTATTLTIWIALTPALFSAVLESWPPASGPTTARVAGLLGFDRAPPAELRVAESDEITAAARRAMGRDWTAERIGGEAALLRTLGFSVTDDEFAAAVFDLLYRRQACAYDARSRTLLVSAEPPSMVAFAEVAGELARQLLEDRLDAQPRDRRGGEAALARRALFDGAVHWAQSEYLARYRDEISASGAKLPAPTLTHGGHAAVLRDWLLDARDLAARQVRHAHLAGGSAAVSALLRAPPATRTALIDPDPPEEGDGPATREAPVDIDSWEFPPSWRDAGLQEAQRGRLSAVSVATFVRHGGDPLRAVRVSTGLRSDAYQRLERRSDRVTVLRWEARFATEDDAAEMIDALRKVLQRRYEGSAVKVSMDPERAQLFAAEEGGHRPAIARRDGASLRFVSGVPDGLVPPWQ